MPAQFYTQEMASSEALANWYTPWFTYNIMIHDANAEAQPAHCYTLWLDKTDAYNYIRSN